MKKLLTLFFISFFIPNIFGQVETDTTSVSFVSYWSIGDSYDYKVTKLKQQWKKGVLKKSDTTKYKATFNVIDSTATSYTINWKFKNQLLNTYKFSEEVKKELSQYSFTDVIYKTSEMGEFQGIQNWEEISKMTKELFTKMPELISSGTPKEIKRIKKAMKPFAEIYSSKEGIEQLVLAEIMLIHFPFGLEYDITEAIEYDDEITNFAGGDPIKAKSKLTFDKVDFEEEYCSIDHITTLDSEDSKRVVNQLLKKMGMKGKEFKKVLKNSIYDITTKQRLEYYYYPGVANFIEAQKTVKIDINGDVGRRVDTVTIELM